MNYLDRLTQIIYVEQNVNRANEYLVGRGVDPSKLRVPWVYTGSDPSLFTEFKEMKLPSTMFTDSLFIPVVSIDSKEVIESFDIRYLGSLDYRSRFYKLKREKVTCVSVYNIHDAIEKPELPIVVTESAIDAETINTLGLPVTCVSPLSSLFSGNFISTLFALSGDVLLMYDNDEAGRKAMDKIHKFVEHYPNALKSFRSVMYKGKDPNETMMTYGRDYLKQVISTYL